MKTDKQHSCLRLACLLAGCLLAFGPVRGLGAADDAADGAAGANPKAESEMDREIRYATGLMDLKLPDYARAVMKELEKKHPEAKAAIARLEVDSFASQGRFQQAEAALAKMPTNSVEAMSSRLAIADRYYQYGKLAKAREGYDAVLGAYPKGPPAELRRFYVESAYRYSQMLAHRNDIRGAVRALRYILPTKPESFVRRTIETEMAEMLVKEAESLPTGPDRKAVLKEASDLCNDVMWEQDALFGRALVVLAHATKLGSDKDSLSKARSQVMSRIPMLESIDAAIRESVQEANKNAKPEAIAAEMRVALRDSPLAQCKYLLGTLHEEEGRALAKDPTAKESDIKAQIGVALGLYFTVIKNYSASTWAPESCQHVDGLLAFAKERGWEIPMPAGVNMEVVMSSRYQEARSLFQESNYSEAAKRYLQALNVAPSHPSAISALGELAQCYIQDPPEPHYARATIGYLSERYGRAELIRMTAAGNALLGVAQAYREAGQTAKARETTLLFADRFPEHERAPVELLGLGDIALRATNYIDATSMYQRVIDKYNKPGKFYNDALSRQIACQLGLGDISNAVATLKTYYNVLPNNAEKISVLVRLGDAYRQLEQWETAATLFGGVVDELNKPDTPYSASADDKERNRKSKERALFFRAYCHSRFKQPAEKVPEFQTRAIAEYLAFLKEFPKSDLAPAVLSNIGTLLYLQDKPEDAGKIFDRLAKEYPDAPQAKGVYFAQFMSLMDIGQSAKAGDVATRMLDADKGYTSSQYLAVGNRLLEIKQHAIAQRVFEKVRAASNPVKDRALWEPASVGLAQALVGGGKPAAAVEPAEELLKRYPTSFYLVPAAQTLSRAYVAQAAAAPAAAKTNFYVKAIGSLQAARRYLKEPGAIAESGLTLADIQLAMGDRKKALAAYQRVFELTRAVDLKAAACMEDAFAKMTPLFLDAKRYDVALEAIDAYLKQFPKGRYVIEANSWKSQIPHSAVSGAEGEQPK